MSLAIRLLPEATRSLAAASFDPGTPPAYVGVGTTIDNPARMLLIYNLTDQPVFFSFDGLDDHIPLPNNGYIVLDIAANKTRESGFFLAEGERLYAKYINAMPTVGSVYFTVFYGRE
jgi:hypothetical protein